MAKKELTDEEKEKARINKAEKKAKVDRAKAEKDAASGGKGKKIKLTNKSSRVYYTKTGTFHPGTSKEVPEKEAVNLLQSGGDIVRTKDYVNEKKE